MSSSAVGARGEGGRRATAGSPRAVLCRVERWVVGAEAAGMVLATLAILALQLMQIGARSGLPFSATIAEEGSRLLKVWLIYLGAAYGVYRVEHFTVDIIMDRLRFPGKAAVELAVSAITLAFLVVIAWAGIKAVAMNATQQLATLGVSAAWANAAMPVGLVLMIYHTVMLPVRGRSIDDGKPGLSAE